MKKSVLPFIIILALIISCAGRAAETDGDWKTDSLENRGINADVMQDMYDRVARNYHIFSFLMAKDGYIISEYYATFFNRNSVFKLHSVTKSVTAALIGIAIDEGLIDSIHTPIKEFFPELSNDKNEITINHLLTMTTGWNWPELRQSRNRLSGEKTRSFSRSWQRAENHVNFVLNRTQIYEPGYIFNFDSGASHLLSAIIQIVSGMPADEYARTRLFDRIGITSARWERDRQGITWGGTGLSMTARDLARFGQLYLNKGKWNGEQIIPEEWINISTTTQVPGGRTRGPFGLHWWVGTITGDSIYETFHTTGFGGQYLFLVPELDTMIIFTSRNMAGNHSRLPMLYISYFFRRLLTIG
jgi:CubicO group peptidase (beta-lactamase class C family)